MSKGICALFLPHFGALATTRAQSFDEVIVHNGAVTTSASMSLLERGLILGDTLHRAKALFPRANLVLRDPSLEDTLWDHIRNQLYRLTPQIQAVSDRRFIGRWILMQGFVRSDLEQLLTTLQAPAGYSTNPAFAMLSAAASRPGQLLIVHPHEETKMLSMMPARNLGCFGFHKSLIELLIDMGLDTLSKIRELTLRQLTAQFQKEGIRLHTLLNSTERTDPIRPWIPEIVYVEKVVEWQVEEERQLAALAKQAIQEGFQQTSSCPRTLSLAIRYRSGQHEAIRHLKAPSRDLPLLTDVAMHLFHESNYDPKDMIGFTLALGRLCPNLAVQADLFSRPEVERLTTLMDRRFPGKLCQPVSVTRAFVPENQYVLAPLHEL